MASESESVKQRPEPVACVACGRPTWSLHDRCVNCRESVQTPPIQPIALQGKPPLPEQPMLVMPELDGHGNIAADVHCRKCGYNLRGLAPTAHCPECELPATRSIFGDWLKLCAPAWIKRLHRGVVVLLLSILASIVLGLIAVIVTIALSLSPAASTATWITIVSIGTTAVTAMVWIAGMWLLTTPDPGAEQTEKQLSSRRVARWCSMTALLAMPLGALQQQGMQFTATPAALVGTLDVILTALSTVLSIIALIGTAAAFIYIKSLALRIPASGLAQQTGVVGCGYVITSAIAQVNALLIIWLMAGFAGPGGPVGAGGAVLGGFLSLGACAVGLASLVFSIWAVVLLFRYAGEFSKAHLQALESSRGGAEANREAGAATGLDATTEG